MIALDLMRSANMPKRLWHALLLLYSYFSESAKAFIFNSCKGCYPARLNSDRVGKEDIRQLKNKGYVLIENFLSLDECSIVINEMHQGFKDYALITQRGEDTRLFGFNNSSAIADKFCNDLDLIYISNTINRVQSYCAFTLAGYLRSGSQGSSGGGWHRDSQTTQFKAMIYLSDVTIHNGPFEIIPYSHKLVNKLRSVIKGIQQHTTYRFSDKRVNEYERLLECPRNTIVAKAGTLLLFNSSSLHRGSPIHHGERYSLTNYYYPVLRSFESVSNQFPPMVPKE